MHEIISTDMTYCDISVLFGVWLCAVVPTLDGGVMLTVTIAVVLFLANQ